MDTHTWEINSVDEMKDQLLKEKGFMESWWCGEIACLDHVKEETGATPRNIPFKQREGHGKCLVCEKESSTTVLFARAY